MKHRSPDGDAFSAIAVHVLYISSLLEKQGDEIAAVAGQTSARWRVLACLENEAKTAASIARDLGLARQSIQRLLNSLKEDRLVDFSENPDDLRADLAHLTKKGHSCLMKIQAAQITWANRNADILGSRSLRYIEASLEKLSETLSKQNSQEL